MIIYTLCKNFSIHKGLRDLTNLKTLDADEMVRNASNLCLTDDNVVYDKINGQILDFKME